MQTKLCKLVHVNTYCSEVLLTKIVNVFSQITDTDRNDDQFGSSLFCQLPIHPYEYSCSSQSVPKAKIAFHCCKRPSDDVSHPPLIVVEPVSSCVRLGSHGRRQIDQRPKFMRGQWPARAVIRRLAHRAVGLYCQWPISYCILSLMCLPRFWIFPCPRTGVGPFSNSPYSLHSQRPEFP